MLSESQTNQTISNQWEELRRQARHCENELDSKLLSFGKLGSRDFLSKDERNSDKVPLLGSSSDLFERMCFEIESLLTKLVEINNQMSHYCQQMQNASAAMYTLQRHGEILHDYTNEFHKTKNNIQAQIEREQLIGNVKRDTNLFTTNKKSDDLYMKEHEHIKNSEKMVDDQINIAIRTRETLSKQRNTFKAFQTQMTTLANRFPMINNLIHRINIKRRKDSIILGCVIGICMTFLILYIF